MVRKLALAAVSLVFFYVAHCKSLAQEDIVDADNDWDPNWNYTQAGADWNFTNCNNLKQQQSPVDLKNPGSNWWAPATGLPFTFLPSYTADVPVV